MNYTYEVNHSRQYTKYDPFIIADVAFQVFYIPYPTGDHKKTHWWIALVNKSRFCPHKLNDGQMVASIFQENVMIPTHTISEALPLHLGDTSHALKGETVASGTSSEGEENDDVDVDEEQEWDDLEIDTEEDDVETPMFSMVPFVYEVC